MSVLKQFVSCTGLCHNLPKPVNLQFVRFRKPRWVPKAPSKVFRVREPTPIDPEEYRKMQTWTNHYNTALKSLNSYMTKHHKKMAGNKLVEQGIDKKKPLTKSERLAIMNNWREQCERMRQEDDERKEVEKREVERYILEREIREKEEMRLAAQQHVDSQKKYIRDIVTLDNLDNELEQLLNRPVSFDFALNLDGTTTLDDKKTETDTLNVIESLNLEETVTEDSKNLDDRPK